MKRFVCICILCSLLSCEKDPLILNYPPSTIENLDLEFITIDIGANFNAVEFIDESIGYVAGYDGIISKTTDGGINWIPLNSNTTLPLFDIHFFNSQEGFIVGGKDNCGGKDCTPEGGIILYTNDGGLTWSKFNPVDFIELKSIYFVNENLGFSVGNNVILKTTDKGLTWSELSIPNLNSTVMEVNFANENFGIITCMFDKLIVTTDGGNNWQTISTTNGIGYYSISSIDETHSFVSSQGQMYKSSDSGQTWNLLENSPSDIFNIHFINESKGFAFGRGNYSGGDFGVNYASLYYTEDAGETWIGNSDIREASQIESISFPNDNLGYALSGGRIIKIIFK